MDISFEHIAGVISVVISLGASAIYIRSVFAGHTKPHVFTWIIWTILPTIGFFAQQHGQAGPGAWATGLTAFASFFITLLALKYGEKHIAKSDWIAFIASLSAILPWLITKDPLGSVILISLIDLVAFYPTFRKSWSKPHEEKLAMFAISAIMMTFSLLALENYSLTTMLYPAAFTLGNFAFIAYCLWRRSVLQDNAARS